MIFVQSKLQGAYLIEPERLEDERGFFARTWCQKEFLQHGLNPRLVQCDMSFNLKRGTWRGLHYQDAPYEEAKLVRCTSGAIYDVIVDLRPDSPTFKEHVAVVLSAENRRMLYIPERFAHGFITLENSTEVFYQMYELIRELYPICRSITGDGVRETLRRLRNHIPLKVHEVPSGTNVFDWTVPKEWNIRDAYVKNSDGVKVIDFRNSNLHILNYSIPVRKKVSLRELREHLFSLPNHADWIPYKTSYYQEN